LATETKDLKIFEANVAILRKQHQDLETLIAQNEK